MPILKHKSGKKSICVLLADARAPWYTRVYLKTPNAPGQRAFLRCAASFFLEIRQYSCEKMSCATQKSLAAGHIMSFQIHPNQKPEHSGGMRHGTDRKGELLSGHRRDGARTLDVPAPAIRRDHRPQRRDRRDRIQRRAARAEKLLRSRLLRARADACAARRAL